MVNHLYKLPQPNDAAQTVVVGATHMFRGKYVTTGLVQPAKSQRKTVLNKRSYFTAAQILGGMLGEKVYVAFQRKILKWPEQENFLFQNLDQQHFDKKYYEYIEIIDSWPVSMKSKFDRF